MKTNFEKLARKFTDPDSVQKFIRSFPYNREEDAESLLSARSALQAKKMHCLEAAFVAAAILEHHGFPPLVMSIESQDDLDHVLYVYKGTRGWGSIGRSRDEGLHGRKAVFSSVRELAASYLDPYVDKSGRMLGYGIANLDEIRAPWRDSPRNVWKVERHLIEMKHQPLKSTEARYRKMLKLYHATQDKNAQNWCRTQHWL